MKTDLLDIRHADCMDLMREFPDGHFSLGIIDPPYGIGFDGDSTLGNNSSAKWKNPEKSNQYQKKDWDKSAPSAEYFTELRRVSRKQIIFGGNYFTDHLPVSGGWIVWLKGTAEGMSLSDAELAWTNCANNVKVCEFLWSGFRKCEQTERFHSTQKPVALYRWLLQNYAKPGDTILDTHLGSGSIAIACHYAGHHLTACELDSDYYKAACERIDRETRQQTLFPTANKEEAYETAALAI
jgi:site-specific DNA-methyltransferase (adenine-specific)